MRAALCNVLRGGSYCIYPHFPLPFHFCLSFLLFLPLLLVQSISLAQRPAKDVDALRRRGCSLSTRRGCGGPGTGARLSAPIPFRFPGLRPLLGPLPVPRLRPRPAPFLTVLAGFGVFGPGRAAASRAAHVDHLHLSSAYTKPPCVTVDMYIISENSPLPLLSLLVIYDKRLNTVASTVLFWRNNHLKLVVICPTNSL